MDTRHATALARKDNMIFALKEKIAELETSVARENKIWVGSDSKSRTDSPYLASFLHTKAIINKC